MLNFYFETGRRGATGQGPCIYGASLARRLELEHLLGVFLGTAVQPSVDGTGKQRVAAHKMPTLFLLRSIVVRLKSIDATDIRSVSIKRWISKPGISEQISIGHPGRASTQ